MKSLEHVMLEGASEEDIMVFLQLPALANAPVSVWRDLLSSEHLTADAMAIFSNQENLAPLGRSSSSERPESSFKQATLRKCMKLIHRNRVGAATCRLESLAKGERPLSISQPNVLQELSRLHPPASPADILPVHHGDIAPLVIDPTKLADIISKLDREAGCGVYPWSNELIQICYTSSQQFADNILSFLSLMINGRLPHRDIWLTSRLVAVSKGDDRVRPIAISDCWIRLGGRITARMEQVLSPITAFLGPSELGIGKKGGAEVLVHSVSLVIDDILRDSDDLAILSLDCSNAFNSIRRSYIAEGVRDACPSLLPFFSWSYGSPSVLRESLASEVQILSSTGVRQGDPLGPMYFCLGMAKTLRALREAYPQAHLLSFFDDMYLIGPTTTILEAATNLSGRLLPLGIHLNESKYKLFASQDTLEAHQEVPLDIRSSDGLKVAGIPLGTQEFVQAQLASQHEDQTRILELVESLPSPEAFVLLKSSVATRPIYFIRGLQPLATSEYTSNFDMAIRSTLSKIVGSSKLLPPSSMVVKNLPIALGGLGMKCL